MGAYINRIGTAVPAHDIHHRFVEFARTLLTDDRTRTVFDRMAERAGIAHRFSVFEAGDIAGGEVDAGGFYRRGAFPSTAARMVRFEPEALALALRAVAGLELGAAPDITHLVVASCTGFTAPGLDLQLAERLGLRADVARTMIGFMGCSAAVPALRTARQIVLSEPGARVLVVNLELCTLHLQETADIETVLSFLLFGDGCAAALVTGEAHGLLLGDFRALVVPDSQSLITWKIGDQGFDMHLSGKVPGRIAQFLRESQPVAEATQAVELWAVHAGGRTVLDAVEIGLRLRPELLRHSRAVLAAHGNMSSATVMFVLAAMLRERAVGARGFGMAFGPGMVAETFHFAVAA